MSYKHNGMSSIKSNRKQNHQHQVFTKIIILYFYKLYTWSTSVLRPVDIHTQTGNSIQKHQWMNMPC